MSKGSKRASICTSEPNSRMPSADTVISHHTCPQMHLASPSTYFGTEVGKISHLKEASGVLLRLFSYTCEPSTGQFLDFGFNPAMKKKCAIKIVL